MNKYFLMGLGILMIIGGIVFGILMGLVAYEEYQKEGELTDCYDKMGNQIIDLKCEITNQWEDIALVGVWMSISLIGFGGIIFFRHLEQEEI